MRLFKQNWWLYPLLLVSITSALTWFVYRANSKPVLAEITSCTGSDESNFKCWQSYYDALVMQQTPKAALNDAREKYESISYIKTNCHQIAHVIGRAGGKKYGDVIKAFNEGDDFCSSGYYHGIMEEIAQEIGPDKVADQVNEICESTRVQKPYSLSHHNCAHGLGHGLMAVFEYELFTSIETCDRLNDPWERESCYSGVFMENIMTSFTDVEDSKYLKDDDPHYPCDAVEDKYKNGCYIIQTAHMLRLNGSNYDKTFDLCAEVKSPYDATCYQSLGRDISGNSIASKDAILKFCAMGDSTIAVTNCFDGAVKDVIWYRNALDPGLELCRAIVDATISTTCTQIAQSYYQGFQ